jgi:hypothetical protein
MITRNAEESIAEPNDLADVRARYLNLLEKAALDEPAAVPEASGL